MQIDEGYEFCNIVYLTDPKPPKLCPSLFDLFSKDNLTFVKNWSRDTFSLRFSANHKLEYTGNVISQK